MVFQDKSFSVSSYKNFVPSYLKEFYLDPRKLEEQVQQLKFKQDQSQSQIQEFMNVNNFQKS